MRKNFILMLMIVSSVVLGHEQNVHRYIVSEAWKLLTYEIPELSNTVMDPWIGSVGNTDYLTSVIAGAHNEDQQDIIYMNCGFQLDFFTWEWVPCTKTTINHFWNADDGDDERVTIMNWNEENALQKAKHMWYGTHNHIIGVSFKPGGIADKIDHSGLPQLHNTGVVKWIGYWNSIGQYFSKNYNQTYSTTYRRRVAYSTLGRMCHLLTDMSVPAHVHEDAHSSASEGGKDDYEQWAKNNYYSYTWEDALEQGGTLFDVISKNYPIRYLMYIVNQYADFFPSDGDLSGMYLGDRDYSTTYSKDGKTDYYPILDDIFSQLGSRPTTINKSLQASHLIPFAIRATAALLFNFAVETGQYTPPTPTTPSISMSGSWGDNPTLSYSGGGSFVDHYILKKEYDFGSGYGSPHYVNPASNPYTDTNVEIKRFGGDLVARYSVQAIDIFGQASAFSNSVTTPGQSLWKRQNDQNEQGIINDYVLESNYPNPFNPNTQLNYQIPIAGFVYLVVYNPLGQIVAEVVNEYQSEGRYSVQFNANNLPSGIYFYKIQAGEFTDVKKMLLTK